MSAIAEVQALLSHECFRTHLIGGAFVPNSTGRTFPSVCPATEAVICEVPQGGAEDVRKAVQAARRGAQGGVWVGRTGVNLHCTGSGWGERSCVCMWEGGVWDPLSTSSISYRHCLPPPPLLKPATPPLHVFNQLLTLPTPPPPPLHQHSMKRTGVLGLLQHGLCCCVRWPPSCVTTPISSQSWSH
jgi:hypothetical protein